MAALAAVVDMRPYSPTSGLNSCDRQTKASGKMTLTTSRSARSCTGFAVDHSKQIATASIPDEANSFNATNARS